MQQDRRVRDDKEIDVLQIVRNMKEFQEKMVERMEAVEKTVELVKKVEGPMADRVVEIAQKEIGEERERRIREWNVVIRGINEVSLREDDEDEKEEEQGVVGGINPPPGNRIWINNRRRKRKLKTW